MGQTITLYRVSLDGQMDIIAFLGEQDAQTYSTILFSGYTISNKKVKLRFVLIKSHKSAYFV